MLDLRSFSGISTIVFPSIRIAPVLGYTNLRIDEVIVDFPAPVRPTTPIFSPALIVKVSFFRTEGSPGLYLIVRLLNSTLPLVTYTRVGSSIGVHF